MTEIDNRMRLTDQWKVGLAFAAMFALYQAAEWLQTISDPDNVLGPALMLAALLVAWPLGRWLGHRGLDAFGLGLRDGWPRLLAAGILLAALAKAASLALAPLAGAGTAVPSVTGVVPVALASAVLTTFVPSVAEDILTRGFLLRTWGAVAALGMESRQCLGGNGLHADRRGRGCRAPADGGDASRAARAGAAVAQTTVAA